ncbi:unnamed protein product [Orchesella dallaii]|uniref:Uncharacterized protein n=1 Tax=Orchesella dallaii TaxID=48710 RepID=A0ABP1QPW2_9HEXA
MRNTRQIPEIPALYSAPKPDIPALYSAPKINKQGGGQESSQNEVDYDDQMRATTEVTMIADDEEDSPEENSSVDYQYGVPTEKYGAPLGLDDEALNDYPTDSPQPTSKTNEIEDQQSDNNDEIDSYNIGYNNHRSNEPSPQYGAPPSSQYGAPPPSPSRQQQPPPPKNGRGRDNSKRKMYSSSPNRRPADQQQFENSLQPTTQMRPNQGGPGESQGAYYLPPSKLEKQQPRGDQRNENTAYGADLNQYTQPKPSSYQAPQPPQQQLKQQPQTNGGFGGEPQQSQQDGSSEGYPRSGAYQPQHSQQRSGIFPQQKSQKQGQQNQPGQSFGRHASTNQPNSFYGQPQVNHFDSGSQDEVEGLNEKIVDAELLQRVQQIIEDHERQQKVLLDNIQKDNEKEYSPPSSSGYPTAAGPSTFTGNELNGPNDFTAPASSPGGSYNPNFQSPNYNRYNSNGIASGDPGARETSRSPTNINSMNDVAPSSSNSRDYPNDYLNPNSYQSGGNLYNIPQQSSGAYTQPSSAQDNGDTSPSSSSAGGYRSPDEGVGKDSEPRKLSSPNVEYQKAVLSTHFTETQPDPQYNSKSTSSSGGYQGQDEEQKLSSVAGPGEEYLPPVPHNRQLEQQQQYELQHGVQNVGYSNSFSADSQVQASNTRENGDEQGYRVQVGTEILVSDGGQPIPSYNYGSLPSQPQPSSSSSTTFSSQQPNIPSRQEGSSASGVFENGERFPSQLPQLVPSHSLFSSQQSPAANPTFWSRGNLSPQPQAAYGTPSNGQLDNGSQPPSSGVGAEQGGSLQIKYSNPQFNDALSDQRAFVQPEYTPTLSASQPAHPYTNNNHAQQPYNNAGRNGVVDPSGNTVMLTIPRPIYGVPLAPLITLDSDNNLPTFNGSPGGGAVGGTTSYSPDPIKTSAPTQNEYALDQGVLGQGRFDQVAPRANYLPPPQYNGNSLPIGNEDLSNSLHLQSSSSNGGRSPGTSYGIRDNNPSSSSSAYLSIQGHGGNSNNHIYNINHNGYDRGSVGSIRTSLEADDSSIIIPGISNTFTLPVYDYSPTSPHHQNGDDELSAAASTSTSTSALVVPLEHLLEQLQTGSQSSPTIFYGSAAGGQQDNIRVFRRALSKRGNVRSAPPHPIQEELGTSRRSNKNNNDSESSHARSSSQPFSSAKPKTNSHLPHRRT